MSTPSKIRSFKGSPALSAAVVGALCLAAGQGARADPVTVTFDFQDDAGPLASNPAATGLERALVDGVGPVADGASIPWEAGAPVTFAAAVSEGAGLVGPQLEASCAADCVITVPFTTLDVEITGDHRSGAERVLVEDLGYLEDGDQAVVPLGGTVLYSAYLSEGSPVHSAQQSALADGSAPVLSAPFVAVRLRLVERGLQHIVPGNNQVHVAGYGAVNQYNSLALPLGSTIEHYAQNAQFHSDTLTTAVDGSWAFISWVSDGYDGFEGPFIDSATHFFLGTIGAQQGIEDATVEYDAGGWQPFGAGVTDATGWASMDLAPGSYTFRVGWKGVFSEVTYDVTDNPIVGMTAQLLFVDLWDPAVGWYVLDEPVRAYYYGGGWQEFGYEAEPLHPFPSTEILPGTQLMRVDYKGVSAQAQTGGVTTYGARFYPVNVRVELRDPEGAPITDETATAEFLSDTWRDIGALGPDGAAQEYLLPETYTFRVTWEGVTWEQQQDISADPTVVFTASPPAGPRVQLLDSTGAPFTEGPAVIKYYASGWQTLGETGPDGALALELPPANYKFRAIYAGAYNQIEQDLSVDPVVTFQTARVRWELKDSSGALITDEAGTARYYSSGWQVAGDTGASGFFEKELLPLDYKLRMSYRGGYVQIQQDVGADPVAVFQTTRVRWELRDSNGALITDAPGTARYYGSGWQVAGDTGEDGFLELELLPLVWKLRMTYAGAYVQIQQDTAADPVAVFQTGQVVSAGGTATHYHSGGWIPFVNGMELLPGTYNFRFSDRPDEAHTIAGGAVNPIP